ncbi:Lambda-carrageenase precursor [Planctomycetes bacterium CA13]|uniref:Lambda-carrageenase n=1 Tax=Novipirellula herctigrandis TaxID=2527986 RepID=A0A5C5YZN0_9BACT|nr:Lambda-carrageenase precursor [Planctomycetes bacterium CA13]
MNKCVNCHLAVLLAGLLAASANAQNFVTGLNGLRNLVSTEVNDRPAIFVSEVSGGVGCYDLDGKELWSATTGSPGVIFEMEADDIDGDGIDELLVASADGRIRCWGNDGTLRWQFNPGYKVRFSEVAAMRENGVTRIFAGGNNFKLYELNENGELVSETKINGVVRKIEVGNFRSKDKSSIFLMTYSHDKFSWEFMGLLDPKSKAVLKKVEVNELSAKEWRSLMLTDFSVSDLNGDELDDLLFFGSTKAGLATFFGLSGELTQIAQFVGNSKHKQRYAHVRGECLLPQRPEIVMQYGGIFYITNLEGKLLHTGGEKNRGIIYNDFALEPNSGRLLAAGQVGGGNSVYQYPLSNSDWWKKTHALQGRMQEVEENLNRLYEQTLEFTPPAYQKRSKRPWMMITSFQPSEEVERLDESEIVFVKQYTWHEDFDRDYLVDALGEEALKRDGRGNYKWRRDQILDIAREHEKTGKPFAAWAGHGNDPFYLSIETIEEIMKVAPNTCYGFVYAEMSNPDDKRYHYFIDHYVPRLAKVCRTNGKAKLFFRYKNVFWAATSHQKPWNRLFFSGKYNDILVPSSEDTNSRTQDINFAGRVGMLASGYVNDVAMRLVDDNPTCWRPLSPGGQRSVSPYLRNGVILAAYGARSGVNFNVAYLEQPGMNILYALMKSGALPDFQNEDVLSIGSWHLIQDVDDELIHQIDNGHEMKLYTPHDEDAVFSVGQVNWCGASVPEHDFSKTLGVDYRWLNFVPELPYGMVPVAPVEYASTLEDAGIPYTVSDGRVGYVDGKPVPAKQFGSTLSSTVKAGASTMPVLVSGASWSAIRLDDLHIRVVLVDPGYIDPSERDVTIRFQGNRPVKAIDILSKESLPFEGKVVNLTVPAGSVRFVDLTYAK